MGHIGNMENKIKQLREAAGLSQTDLAEKIGSGRSQVAKLERGERQLTQSWMLRISAALDVTPTDLLPGSSKETELLFMATDRSTRVTFLQALFEEGILLSGADLSPIIDELDTYCATEDDTLKVGMKLGELVARAKSLPKRMKSEPDLEVIAAEALQYVLDKEGIHMPTETKEEAIKEGIKVFLDETEKTKMQRVIVQALKKVS
ncbi:helix-turn-helix domain-containing protein [Kiloniella majae]|uniref:helix-turn-helix domain-containing protein n=1 Tax=Kiloniella majae TaxID=1938558 RepID=UPI000A277273|nr:helix-turn-helix transcriptional regulator [Kiloniella majae]